ncbi:solute carrier family 22 member 13-like isoform X1 [Nothoprocta perdicaria]|uniref:solute carrier family 22 member 13-like isoform X1 n=1 Tax=Nothoprocta perdicaria TaxID=30464 RepID=UPI000E1B651C|nr:solute carrier family 22 member 13-like isoform X1 [Nothoprocta perdicaria]
MFAFGDILNALGEFGRFQKWLVVLLSLPVPLTAFHMLGQVFMLVDVPHYCNTSWIRAVGPNLTEDELLNLTVPRGASGAYEQCSMYSPVDRDLDSIVAYGLNATQKCSNGWVYPSTQTPSLLTEFDLVCDKKDLNDISQAIYMLGLLLGAMIFGPLSDRIGRRPVILISMLIQGLFGVGIAFVPHFYVYMAFRCVVGASMSGITMTILALAMEWVGVSYRPHAVLVSHCCFAIGQMILAGLSYGIRNWRLLQIAGSVPIFALFFYFWVLPESARWLMTKGRVEEAKKILQKAASMNKRTIPPGLLEQLKPEVQTKPGSTMDLFRKKHLCKVTLIMLCAWFANSLAYYGISLNVTNFGLDIYLTQLAFGAVEIPARASCILLLQWFGRKKCQGFLLLLSGLVCLIITGIPEDLPVVITVLAIIGKFATSASFSTSYVYTAELFPTVVRQTGVGLCSMSARVAGIIAPLIRLLARYHHSVPMAIFGSVPVLAGLLCFLLHETRGMDLVDDTSAAAPQHRSCENANRSSENGHVKAKGGDLDKEHAESTYF